ncbi:MAG TPA: hypothetical protein VF245_03710 [Solirubrobacterales bacterium]
MTRKILTLIAVLGASVVPIAHAGAPGDPMGGPSTYTVVLAGGSTQNTIDIWLTPDGTEYAIDSAVPLEVGGTVCHNAPDNPNELLCQAPLVAGFVVTAGPADDIVKVAASVQVPATLSGGPGRDVLQGGNGADKLIGGAGRDVLSGGGGNDAIYGGAGNDVLNGGSGNDALWGGPGRDVLHPGSGHDSLHEGLKPGFRR